MAGNCVAKTFHWQQKPDDKPGEHTKFDVWETVGQKIEGENL